MSETRKMITETKQTTILSKGVENMDKIMIENTEKTPIKVAEKFTELEYPYKMYVLGVMQGILSKSNSEQNKSA